MTALPQEEIDEARSADIDPGTFDASSYKLLRRFLPHQQIIEAMQPDDSRHGVGIPLEYLYQALANNRGNYDYAVGEAESYLDRDALQAQVNRSAFMGSRSSPISKALSTNLLDQESHDEICDHLADHHATLAARSGDSSESNNLFSGMVPTKSVLDGDNIENWDGQDYSGAHNWMQSEIGKLKASPIIQAGFSTDSGVTNLMSDYDIFNHINKAIHSGEQLSIKYRGYKDPIARTRTIVPSHAWIDPKGGMYIRAYDPNSVGDDGIPGAWRTFRGSGVSGMSTSQPLSSQPRADADASKTESIIQSLDYDGYDTSLNAPRKNSKSQCYCSKPNGLHTLPCYENMSKKLIKHYTAQLVSACVNPVAGESPRTISPQTIAKLISTRRKLAIATRASESAFFPYAYSKDRHGE